MFKRGSSLVIAVTLPFASLLEPWSLAVGLPLVAFGYANARLYAEYARYAASFAGRTTPRAE